MYYDKYMSGCHIGSADVNSFNFIRYIIRQKEIGCTHTPYFFLSSNALWKNISDRRIIILYIFLIFVNSFRLIIPTNFVLKTLAFSVIFFAIVKLCRNNTAKRNRVCAYTLFLFVPIIMYRILKTFYNYIIHFPNFCQ